MFGTCDGNPCTFPEKHSITLSQCALHVRHRLPPFTFPPFIHSSGYRWFNSLCDRAEDQQRARTIMIDYMTQTFPVWSLFVRVFEPFYSVVCLWPAAGLAKTLSFLLLLHRPDLPLASLCCKPFFLQQIILWWEFESAVDWLAVVVQFKT